MSSKGEQVPNTEQMSYKVIALTRMVCPEANIPSTTALATLNREQGRELGLMRGANVVMPNLTPLKYRIKYEIYPSEACISEIPSDGYSCLNHRIQSIGRRVGTGRGDRVHKVRSKPPHPVMNRNLFDLIEKNENNKLRGSKIFR